MTAAVQGTGPFRHDLVLHDGPAELLEMMVPFVRDGTAAGEQVLLLGERDFVDAIVAEVPEVAEVSVLAERHGQRFPGRELHRAQQALARLDDTGRRVRIVNQMPAMTAQQWLGWRRYEAAANVALAPYPAWGKCAHDLANLDPHWLDELRASHPYVHTGTVEGSNPDYDERADYTRAFFDVPRHPVEATEPTLTLVGPTAAAARRAVGGIAAASGLSPTAQECAILATSETVTNGSVHGRPPVRLRAWSAPGRVTVAVSDSGRGPHPLVGMLAELPESTSGRGMWMVHLLIAEVHHRRADDGYTITFSVDDSDGSGL